MNACEWALLLGHAPAVTIHLIDRGIDTGTMPGPRYEGAA
jgi:methionyl-tRNA formyltransferase